MIANIKNVEDLLSFNPEAGIERIVVDGFVHPLIQRNETYMDILKRDQRLDEDSEPVRRVLLFLKKLWTTDEDYGGFRLLDIEKNSNITLEIIDSYLPLCILRHIKLPQGRIGSLIFRNTERFVRENQPIPIISDKPLNEYIERLVIGENAVVDCTNLSVHQLVLFNHRCAINLSKATKIHTLVIVHGISERISLPTCHGLKVLVLPQEQEVEYTFMKTKIPEILGFIPSKFEPSAFARGIQLAREPYEKSHMDEEVFDMYTRAFIKI